MYRKPVVIVVLLIVLAMALGACIQPLAPLDDGGSGEGSGEEITLYVGPTLADCTGAGPQTCMLVKTDPEEEYTYFYDRIDGFQYIPGHEYELAVLVEDVANPPADASSLRYTLIEVVDAIEVGPTLEGTPWQMVGVADENGQPTEALPDVEVTALFEDGQLSGSGGCNSYVTSYEVEGTELRIDPQMAGTLMACDDPVMQQATAFQAALTVTRQYQIVENQLRLLDENYRVVATFEVREPTSLTGTLWTAIGYNNGKEAVVSVIVDTEITAIFAEDGTLSGSAGCNNYTAGYEADDVNIKIGPAAVTMMMCSEPENLMEQEALYLAALEMAEVYTVDGDRLQLRTGEGSLVADYRAASPADAPVGGASEREEPTDTAASANDEESVKALGNLEYQNISAVDGPIQMTDGKYEGEPFVEGGASRPTAEVTETIATGEIDGQPAAAVIIYSNAGGSGGFLDLALVMEQAGKPTNVATIMLGDRVEINSLAIKENQIVVDMVQAGPDDPMCCPTQHVVNTYAYEEGQLVEKSSEVIGTVRAKDGASTDGASKDGAAAGSGEEVILEGTPWQMVTVVDENGQPTDALTEVEVTALFEDGRVGGSDGCNNYSGSYTVDGTSLVISPDMAMTMMACQEPIMQQAAAYGAALAATQSYEIMDNQLRLHDENGRVVVVFDVRVPNELVGTTWSATGYNNGKGGVTSLVIGTEITAIFDAEGALSGSAGCNNYSAGYEVDEENIEIGQASTTRKMCQDPEGVMEQEGQYLAALQMANVYRIDGDKLELRTNEGALVASYVAVADDASAEGEAETPAASTEGDQPSMDAAALVSTLANLEYRSEFTAKGTAPLVDGEYSEAAAPGSATKTTVSLTEHMATGELNGQPAATVVLVTDPGGSGTFFDLAVVLEVDGKPINLATTSLGDRVQINSIAVEDNQIVIDMVQAGADDPMCCPSQQVVKTFALERDKLVETGIEVVGTIESDEKASAADADVASQPAAERDGIVGVEWHWFEFEGGDGHQIFVRDPNRYTLTLNPDGTAAVLADCNNGNGNYELDGSSLTINIMAVTRALCPPDSLSDDYLRLLGEVVTYVEQGDTLALNLMADAGNLLFQLEEATDAKAHDPTVTVPQDAITVDPGPLAISYHWQVLPATPYDASMPPVPVGAPPHAVVTFDYLPAPKALIEGGPYIVVYPVAEYVELWQSNGNEAIAGAVIALQSLLDEKPANPKPPLPILPPPGAVNDLAVQTAYLDFGGGSGIRFVGRLSQDASPVLYPQLAYYFQGLTDDGRFYVSMRWPVITSALPGDMTELTPEEQQTINSDFEAYMGQTAETLNGLAPADWSPNLDHLDALIGSFELRVPAAE